MANGVDCDQPATGAVLGCLAASGYRFVGRYLDNGTNGGRCLTAAEVGVFRQHNQANPGRTVGIVPIWSSGTSNQPCGWTADNGSRDGWWCALQLQGLTLPTGTGVTIYVDTEVTGALTGGEIDALSQYLDAYQRVLGGRWRLGLYGQGGAWPSHMLQSVCDAGVWYAALPFWATNAQPTCGAAIIQRTGQAILCGYTTDAGETSVPAFGVWTPL